MSRLEYCLTVETGDNNEYPTGGADGWTSVSHEIWPRESSFPETFMQSSSSPITSSHSSSFSSAETADFGFGCARKSSTISPSVQMWSEDPATPPVTPQHNRTWNPFTPVGIPFQPYPTRCIRSGSLSENCTCENENIWTPEKWHLPLLPLSCQQISEQHEDANFDGRGIFVPSNSSADPALSRQIFADSMHVLNCPTPNFYPVNVHSAQIWSSPETIAPRATIQSMLPSSPLTGADFFSPLKMEGVEPCDIRFDSSPLPASSPHLVLSQDRHEGVSNQFETSTITLQPVFTRKACDRNTRRPYQRRALASVACRPRKATNDVTCDVVIPQNTFACSYPGCTDKSTGRQKRFKRQEHRKRHEISVHGMGVPKMYFCWVPGCCKGFTRTDNLKHHIKGTHGKNSPSQRNRYVATLDPQSQYYDPTWRGELTEDGYPITPEVAVWRCGVSDCDKAYLLEEKLKSHWVQKHGKKASSPDASCKEMVDDKSDTIKSEPHAQ